MDSNEIARHLPEGLALQQFDGSAWVGLVPFRMHRVMRRPFPALFGQLSFPELNLRTYVEARGKPGVWFFSLDADNRPIVSGGRRIYNLPYHRARMSHRKVGEWIEFKSARIHEPARLDTKYRPVGATFRAESGTFEHWMAERYCMYSADTAGRLRRVEVHHGPWPLREAEAVVGINEILDAARIPTDGAEPVVHFATGVDVVSFGAKAVNPVHDSGTERVGA